MDRQKKLPVLIFCLATEKGVKSKRFLVIITNSEQKILI